MKSIDLSTEISGIRFSSPLFTASGTAGYGDTFLSVLSPQVGGFITKGISLKPRAGNPPPRICETPCGLLNAIGLENIGLEAFLREILPLFKGRQIPLIVNIFGESIREYTEIATRLSSHPEVSAIELNVSCPNVKAGGMVFGKDMKTLFSLVAQIKKETPLPPLWVKLTPNVTDILDFARVVEDAGADAVTIANSYTGIAVDVDHERLTLGNLTGGLTGPAIKPLSQYAVWRVASQISLPVIASGGCSSARDVLEYLLIGAQAVQIGTMALVRPDIFSSILQGIETFMERKNLTSLQQWIGHLYEKNPRE